MRRESAAAPAARRTAEPATFATAQEMALGTVLRCVRRVVEDSTDTSRRLLTMRYNAYYRAYGSVRGPELFVDVLDVGLHRWTTGPKVVADRGEG